MKTSRIRWEIDLEADSPTDAARQALEIQRDPESTAVAFTVDGQRMDLRYRCNLCDDRCAIEELRVHLRGHVPAADSALHADDLEGFFTCIA